MTEQHESWASYVDFVDGACVVVTSAEQGPATARKIRAWSSVSSVTSEPLESDYVILTVRSQTITDQQLLAQLTNRLYPQMRVAWAFFANHPNGEGVVVGLRFKFPIGDSFISDYAEALVLQAKKCGYDARIQIKERHSFIIALYDNVAVKQHDSSEALPVEITDDPLVSDICDLCEANGIFVAFAYVCPKTDMPAMAVIQQIRLPIE